MMIIVVRISVYKVLLPCRTKRQYLLTLQVSRCCFADQRSSEDTRTLVSLVAETLKPEPSCYHRLSKVDDIF